MTRQDVNSNKEDGQNPDENPFELKTVESIDFEVDAVGDLVLYVSEATLLDKDSGEEMKYTRTPPQKRMNLEGGDL